MNSRLNGRLEKLEAHLKIFAKSPIWVDLFDNRVRVDIGGKHGEELTFDNIRECVEWTDKQIAQFEKVTGVACIGDVSELVHESFRDTFNQIYEGAPNGKVIVINLHNLGDWSISGAMLATWMTSFRVSAYQDFHKEVLARMDALSQSLDDDDEEEEDFEIE